MHDSNPFFPSELFEVGILRHVEFLDFEDEWRRVSPFKKFPCPMSVTESGQSL